MMTVRVITKDDNLHRLVDEINRASWDDANEMSSYDADALSFYLGRQDTLFVACYDSDDVGGTLLGVASARVLTKPYAKARWLYVDEVDVCADQRQKGAGKAIMRTLIEFAKKADCEEVWLGTEVDNHPANALYQSLNPADIAQVVGYTYETQE